MVERKEILVGLVLESDTLSNGSVVYNLLLPRLKLRFGCLSERHAFYLAEQIYKCAWVEEVK